MGSSGGWTRRLLWMIVAAAAASAATPTMAQADGGPVVRTGDGRVRGERIEGVEAFRGIPYAAAPVGALRFAPPAPARRRRGTLDATGVTPPCPQLASSNGPTSVTEDCLLLDVWRPRHSRHERRRGRDLPVLVFIHGGGDVNGSAGQQHPSRMVRQTDSIVVTINYRLGIFGWLALPSQGGAAGNLGVLDQQAALRWVRDNVERFGGDPTNVTVGGESAGGWAVCAHLVAPGSADLFDRAIIESITCTFRERDAALEQGTATAAALGCRDAATAVACLRGKDVAALLDAWGGGDARPVAGGSTVPLQPMEAIDAGDYNKVPVIWGNTFDELSFDMLANPDMTPEELRAGIAATYPTHVDAILAEYAAARSPAWAYSAARNDPFICGMHDQAGRLSKSTLVWYYEFDDQDPPPEVGIDINLGAYHSSELQYLYGFDRSDGTPKQSRGLDAAQQRLATEMIGYWGAFAAKGAPNHPGALRWPRFDLRAPRVLRFGPGGTTVVLGSRFDADHHCGFWKGLGVPLEHP
jgi:carboxylesterase type B